MLLSRMIQVQITSRGKWIFSFQFPTVMDSSVCNIKTLSVHIFQLCFNGSFLYILPVLASSNHLCSLNVCTCQVVIGVGQPLQKETTVMLYNADLFNCSNHSTSTSLVAERLYENVRILCRLSTLAVTDCSHLQGVLRQTITLSPAKQGNDTLQENNKVQSLHKVNKRTRKYVIFFPLLLHLSHS